MKKFSVGLLFLLVLSFIVLSINAQDNTEASNFTLRTFALQENAALGLAVSPDGTMLIVGGGPIWEPEQGFKIPSDTPNTITAWDMETGEIIRQFESTAVFVADVALSPDGQQIIGALDPDTVGIWDIENGELLRQYDNIYSGVVAISPDGQTVISNQRAANPVLWEFQTGEIIHTFEEITGLYGPVAFSPDNTTVAVTVGIDEASSNLVLWDTETNSEIYRLTDFTFVPDIEFSPDGQLLAIATVDRGILLIDVETGEVAHEFASYQTPTGEIINLAISVTFSADGQQLLSSWEPGNVVLWDIETGVSTFVGSQENRIWRVRFTPDGIPVTSSYDGTINMWIPTE